MTNYRSAQGKTIDMSVLSKKNETVRAVGNMNVNARGDVVDDKNHVIKDKNSRISGSYNRTITNNDLPQKSTYIKPQPIPVAPVTPTEVADLSPDEKELFDDVDEMDEKSK